MNDLSVPGVALGAVIALGAAGVLVTRSSPLPFAMGLLIGAVFGIFAAWYSVTHPEV